MPLVNTGSFSMPVKRRLDEPKGRLLGQCADGSLKNELVHRARFLSRQEAMAALFEYIAIFYDRQRRHSSIGCRTPEQARIDMAAAMAA